MHFLSHSDYIRSDIHIASLRRGILDNLEKHMASRANDFGHVALEIHHRDSNLSGKILEDIAQKASNEAIKHGYASIESDIIAKFNENPLFQSR